MAAVSILVDVPNLELYDIEEMRHKLTIYAKKLVKASQKKEMVKKKQYNHKVLAGILSDEKTGEDLKVLRIR